jgi:hypothetical protein
MQDIANPTVNAILQTNKEMAAALSQAAPAAAKPKSKKAGRRVSKKHITASSALAIYDLGLQRLRALKSHFDQTYNPLVQLLSQQRQGMTLAPTLPLQPAVQAVAATAAAAQPSTSRADESSAGSITMRSRVLEVLPKPYHAKYRLLCNYLNDNPDAIQVSTSGRPVINGVELPRSSFVDAMRSLYVWRKQTELPPGAHDIIQALQSLGVPSTLLSSAAARNVYQDILDVEQEGEAYESTAEDVEMNEPAKPAISQPGTSQRGQGHAAMKWPGTQPEVLYLYKP